MSQEFVILGLFEAPIGGRIWPQGVFFGPRSILVWRGRDHFVMRVPHHTQYWGGSSHLIAADAQVVRVLEKKRTWSRCKVVGESVRTGRQYAKVIARLVAKAKDLDGGMTDDAADLIYPDLAPRSWPPSSSPPRPGSPPKLIGALTRDEREVILIKHEHEKTWRDRSDWYWFWHLVEEVIEAGLALLGLHRHSAQYELRQIASISMNFLEKLGPEGHLMVVYMKDEGDDEDG